MKKYRITLTKEQLMLIANCVEDCHRFACGETELWNTTSAFNIKEWEELRDRLEGLQPLVTPELGTCASYGWNGTGCKDEQPQPIPLTTEILEKNGWKYTTYCHEYQYGKSL